MMRGNITHLASLLTKQLQLLLLCAILTLISTVSHAAVCQESDKDCIAAAHSHHVVNRLAYWKTALAKPFNQRIAPAPAELIDYLKLDNMVNGYPERPTSAIIPPDFRSDLDSAIAEIPDSIKHALSRRLVGIYLVHNLGGSGFTEAVSNAAGKPVAAYVVLDLDVLSKRNANAWETWKENTPFRPSNAMALQATIERPIDDNRKNAIQYILLHEFGHAFSVGQHFHPSWATEATRADLTQYPFFALSWRVGQKPLATRYDDSFTLRKDVVYYWGAKLDANRMADVYSQLEATDFPTLYAATNPYDDFAESFVNYVHTVLMGKPFSITIINKDGVLKRYQSCWAQQRCAAKRKILEQALADY